MCFSIRLSSLFVTPNKAHLYCVFDEGDRFVELLQKKNDERRVHIYSIHVIRQSTPLLHTARDVWKTTGTIVSILYRAFAIR